MPTHIGEWPAVGRDEIVREIHRVLALASGPGVLLVGEAGVGKTRLADLVLTRLAGTGALVLRGAATEATTGIPGMGLASLHVHGDVREPAAGRLADAAAQGRQVVIGIDDADHLDASSAAAISGLSETMRLKLVLTARQGTIPDVGGGGRPAVLPLGRLSRDALSDLLTRVLGGQVDGLTAHMLWRLTRGNPRLLRRAVEIGLETGRLARDREVWSWRGRELGHPRVRELATADLGTFEEDQSRALEYVALSGSLPLEVLDFLVGREVTTRLLDRAVIAPAAGRVRQVTMAHPFYGQALLTGLGTLRRRQAYRDLVTAAGQAGVPGPHDPRLVLWRLRADLPVPVHATVAAGEAALDAGDVTLAGDLSDHIPGPRGAALRGQSLIARGRPEEGERLLAEHCPGGETSALRSLSLFWGLNRAADARAELSRARESQSGAGEDLDVADLSLAIFTRRGTRRSLDISPLAPPRDRRLDPLVAEAAVALRAYHLTFGGSPARAASAFDGETPLPLRWPAMRGSAAACHVYALVLAGRLREAVPLAERYYEEAVRRGEPTEAVLLSHQRGLCAMWAGQPRRALAPLREARALVDDHTPFPVRVFIGCEYAVCVATLGHLDEAYQELDRLRERIPDDLGVRDRVEFSRIRLLAYSGRLAYAADLADRLADQYLSEARLTTAVECAYFHARLRPTSQAAERLRAVAGRCDSPLFELFARHAGALARRDAGSLRAVAAEFTALGYLGLALEASLAAKARLPEQPADRRLADLAELCDGFHSPWLDAVPRAFPRLTSREREVCELAASGLSNPAIAADLGVSVRTVANLLGRAYEKLGIRSRRHLASALDLKLSDRTPG
ncbi:LuxR C-terminal-related transcriptional regulator [Sphaerisporangium viridialbum]|uniref:LuxR C-terminal-related transcriptional regulator n=1 Tax=Sphaerisporangium viridialbum TaxID=46189 RepID=UPI003C7906FD